MVDRERLTEAVEHYERTTMNGRPLKWVEVLAGARALLDAPEQWLCSLSAEVSDEPCAHDGWQSFGCGVVVVVAVHEVTK